MTRVTGSVATATAVQSVRRGKLRVYLGAAPGVGKTFDMLNEGRRARERGVDVVVGFVETYGRRHTAEQIGDLEVVPRRVLTDGANVVEEMDVDAILARRPERVLIDELAHTNAPGSRNEKRRHDVEDLLSAGIDVISTLNIQHLESVNDVAQRITGVGETDTVPDEIVRAAEQVELVDQTPEALRRRMAHGNIYAPDDIDAALGNYFRVGNLAALRELALLWVADQVDVELEQYRERHGISDVWETRERVVVGLTGAPGTDALIRRAARIAQRAHGDLIGVHITNDAHGGDPRSDLLDDHRQLLTDLGGEYRDIVGADIAEALVQFARAENATQLILGSSHRSRWTELLSGSVINRVARSSGPIDVHIVSHSTTAADSRPLPRPQFTRTALPPRRRQAAWVLTGVGVALLTVVLAKLRDHAGLPTVLLLYLTLVVTIAVVGGRAPAMVAALASFLAANWYFTPPYYELSIGDSENVIALVVFLTVAFVVRHFVDTATRRALEAARARTEARTLAGLAATVGEDDPLPILLTHLRDTFGVEGVSLLRRRSDRGWDIELAAGQHAPTSPDTAAVVEPLTAGLVLALGPPPLAADDQLVLNAFAAQLSAVLERSRLRAEAGRAESLAEASALRAALLQAVSHDLRTPLASIKASVSSLEQDELTWTAQETREFVRTISDETDRLTTLIDNLLDMSRIHAGAVEPHVAPVALEEVVPAAITSLGVRAGAVDLDLPETLPPVLADAALLERAVANLIANAVRFSPPDIPVRVQSGVFDGHLDLRIIDRGPGIPAHQREHVFQPFQRLGDKPGGTGVGLGLAVARGFLDAIGATIELDDTAAGGTTAVIRMRIAK
jgi:two-component system sensor histidine kinase KdpD